MEFPLIYLQVANLILNVLMIPLLIMIWNVRVEQARMDSRLTTLVEGITVRVVRMENWQDKRPIT